jgi:hypothetical protein
MHAHENIVIAIINCVICREIVQIHWFVMVNSLAILQVVQVCLFFQNPDTLVCHGKLSRDPASGSSLFIFPKSIVLYILLPPFLFTYRMFYWMASLG